MENSVKLLDMDNALGREAKPTYLWIDGKS
jgi:hypothetical protein